jgi:phenylpropionate dioxygenase-like ring-hydroxylating dioxygenase large terminal subunit
MLRRPDHTRGLPPTRTAAVIDEVGQPERDLDMQDDALIYDSVSEELGRKAYPEHFPALPEVPSARYSDMRMYELEMKHLWRKSWLHACHMSEVPDEGSYKLFEQVGLSIIISRGSGDEVRAFHNICRHRGSRVVLEKAGRAKRFVCPYHSWTYDREGTLLSVPEARDFACLDKSKRGLMPVRCEVFRGMIFINLDMDAAPLSEFLEATDGNLGEFPLQDMQVKNVFVVEMACNWKTALDNFLEIYHVNSVHANSIAPYLQSKSFSVSLYKGGHARFATRKRGDTIFGADLTVSDAAGTLFRDHTIALPMFPNSFMAVDPAGFAWQTWWPTGPRSTIMVMRVMGWPDESDKDADFWESMASQMRDIANEDQHLFAGMQESLDSGLLPGILMGYQERALYWYHEEIDRQIGVDRIPAELRIEPMLSGHIQH